MAVTNDPLKDVGE